MHLNPPPSFTNSLSSHPLSITIARLIQEAID
jgi:hypothetical protein